jgi:hypothetical protein
VLELLWETHRLRSTIARANQVRHFLSPGGHGVIPNSVWEHLRNELNAGPCLENKPAPRRQAQIDSIGKQPFEERADLE